MPRQLPSEIGGSVASSGSANRKGAEEEDGGNEDGTWVFYKRNLSVSEYLSESEQAIFDNCEVAENEIGYLRKIFNTDPKKHRVESVAEYECILKYFFHQIMLTLPVHYRGEKRKYSIPMLCTFLRKYPSPQPRRELEEVREFRISKRGREIMRTMNKAGINNPENHYCWWFLTQHLSDTGREHREQDFCTRLLDVTRNKLVALFFACQGMPQEDGVVFIMFQGREVDRSDYATFEDFINDPKGKYDEYECVDPSLGVPPNRVTNFYLSTRGVDLPMLRPHSSRIINQEGEFRIQHTRRQKEANFLLIDGGCKKRILAELKKRGIHEDFVYARGMLERIHLRLRGLFNSLKN